MTPTAADVELGILNITNEEHHAIRALSNSGMSKLKVSTLRYWYHEINPAPKVDEEETAAQRMGSALHCAVLEGEEAFDARYVRKLDAGDWPVCLDTVSEIRSWVADNGGTCKGTRKDDVIASAIAHMEKIGKHVPILAEEERRFFAQHGHKTILSVEEWERLAGMAGALLEEKALRPILEKGKPEVSMVARDPETGVLLKSRLDWMAPAYTLDLKTFSQKRGKSIDQSVHEAIYHEEYWRQSYFYAFVRSLVTGEKISAAESVIAFVESDQPHETRIRRLVPRDMGEAHLYWETARLEVRRMIRLYADCLARFGDEPWRTQQEIETLTDDDVPAFAFRR